MRRWPSTPAILCCVVIAMTGCDDADTPAMTDTGADAPTTIADAETVTSPELFDRLGTEREGETVIVDALLFEDESGLRICEQLAESFPARCVGRTLTIRNPGAVDVDFTETEGIRWTDRAVPLLGWIEDGEFVVT